MYASLINLEDIETQKWTIFACECSLHIQTDLPMRGLGTLWCPGVFPSVSMLSGMKAAAQPCVVPEVDLISEHLKVNPRIVSRSSVNQINRFIRGEFETPLAPAAGRAKISRRDTDQLDRVRLQRGSTVCLL